MVATYDFIRKNQLISQKPISTHSLNKALNVGHIPSGVDSVSRYVSISVQHSVLTPDLNPRLVAPVHANKRATADDVVLSLRPEEKGNWEFVHGDFSGKS